MGHDFGFGFPGLGMILFWVVIIGLGVLIVRVLARGHPRIEKSPKRILEERYARGDIDRDEFEQKRRELSE